MFLTVFHCQWTSSSCFYPTSTYSLPLRFACIHPPVVNVRFSHKMKSRQVNDRAPTPGLHGACERKSNSGRMPATPKDHLLMRDSCRAATYKIKHTVGVVGHCIHRLIPRLSIGAGHNFAALSCLSISGLQNLYCSALLINILELMHSVTYSAIELSKL